MNSHEEPSPQELMSAQERARLVVALDHDVRQPLHSIEMGLRTLRLSVADLRLRRQGEFDDHVLQKMTAELASIQAAVRQVTDTQQDLFDAIRLESGLTYPNIKTIRAGTLIERVVKTNRSLAADFELQGSPSRLSFVSDERWVERILTNLVGNAISHSRGSRILVGARRRGSDIVFEVRDNGRGLPESEKTRIFDPVRPPVPSPIASSTPRSGLGLYNVRLFVHRLGGSVDCISRQGLGTRFRVTLPGPVSAAEREPTLSEVAGAADARHKFVAVLDGDLLLLRETERALQRLEIEVYGDHDPLRWLTVVTDLARVPDLILLDIRLGTERALLYLDILRRKWMGRDVKIVFCSQDPHHPQIHDFATFAPVLKKPLSQGKLKYIVDVLASRAKLPTGGFV